MLLILAPRIASRALQAVYLEARLNDAEVLQKRLRGLPRHLPGADHRGLPLSTAEPRGSAHLVFSRLGCVAGTGSEQSLLLLTGRVETRGEVLQRSESAQPPADGEAVLVTGRVRAAPPLLTAPLSGTPCVAYFYRMYRLGMRGPDRGEQRRSCPSTGDTRRDHSSSTLGSGRSRSRRLGSRFLGLLTPVRGGDTGARVTFAPSRRNPQSPTRLRRRPRHAVDE